MSHSRDGARCSANQDVNERVTFAVLVGGEGDLDVGLRREGVDDDAGFGGGSSLRLGGGGGGSDNGVFEIWPTGGCGR